MLEGYFSSGEGKIIPARSVGYNYCLTVEWNLWPVWSEGRERKEEEEEYDG